MSSDRVDFNHPIPAGSIVELIGQVVKVGNTSLKVEVFVENMHSDGRAQAIKGTSASSPWTRITGRSRAPEHRRLIWRDSLSL